MRLAALVPVLILACSPPDQRRELRLHSVLASGVCETWGSNQVGQFARQQAWGCYQPDRMPTAWGADSFGVAYVASSQEEPAGTWVTRGDAVTYLGAAQLSEVVPHPLNSNWLVATTGGVFSYAAGGTRAKVLETGTGSVWLRGSSTEYAIVESTQEGLRVRFSTTTESSLLASVATTEPLRVQDGLLILREVSVGGVTAILRVGPGGQVERFEQTRDVCPVTGGQVVVDGLDLREIRTRSGSVEKSIRVPTDVDGLACLNDRVIAYGESVYFEIDVAGSTAIRLGVPALRRPVLVPAQL